KGIGLCVADTEDGETPLVPTGAIGYFRLRREAYDARGLKQWLGRMRDADFERVYVFFKHEDAGAGPKLAERFQKLADR
ncbi:MAG: DUF72 domain-containing protein, partial [Gemmatimonadales bacterium]